MSARNALPRGTCYALLATATLSLTPFLPHIPWGMGLLAVLLLGWRAWLAHQEAERPALTVLILLAVLGCVLCFAEYRTVLGREAGLAMLSLLLPLKLLEGRSPRDGRAALLLCCFLMTGQFLNEQSLPVAAMVLACAIAILATSARLERPSLALKPALRGSLRLLGGSVPLMLMLFVFFPRIDGPLWRLPGDAHAGKTGLSDSMQPGSISELIQSGEIAFRAEFEGELPPPRERYWRGPVLTDFDGQRWRERPTQSTPQPDYETSGPGYRYTLTLEPHDRPWLLALDYPAEGASDATYSSNFSLLARRPVSTRLRISLHSFPASQVGLEERPGRLRAALGLPEGSNPRTVAAGQTLAAAHADPGARVDAAIAFMQAARLSYTLSPPLANTHAADEFLFDSKQGFCEHFSSAFVILMRAAGVPARVVTGYQGGERNPVDGILVIRQSDAHAWAEVWLAGRGWVRVDPTAASAPARIDDGIAQALPDADLPMMMRVDSDFLRGLRHRWEAVSNGWNQWVLGYNASRQLELMRRLGLPAADWRLLTALLGAGAGLWLGWLAWRLWPRRAKLDALDRLWQRACRKLARRGLQRAEWEAPTDFARRAALALPAHADTITDIAEHYASLRFGPTPPTAAALAALRRAVQDFKP
ncbi:DUF3488 and transglutaminase-like domain-containing protein [Uliginosibacterium sp. TH139]|uniref:transglutaminase TgpA family protein n=1 Tax=Uliginosibacterium sp. TH139 TaxID=2067453 RepID=UPI000C7AD4CF|nr:DUF3488 and transglutaminase-like domain-containing protein [Uliginosibacterium sp. TH139]PLK49961.1 DUF3488 domain-containing protein [Uliginosibacterium sp. TH139]